MVLAIHSQVALLVALGFILTSCQITTVQSTLQDQIDALEKKYDKLDFEVQIKNDDVYYLAQDVRALNATLLQEQQKTIALDGRVTALEANLTTAIKRFENEKNTQQATANQVTALQTQLQSTQQQLNATTSQLANVRASISTSQSNAANERTRLERLLNQTIDKQTQLAQKSSWKRNETYFSYRQATTEVADVVHFTGRIAASATDYDPTTGVFTAPKRGLYWFSATIGAEASDFVSCYIMRNGDDYLVELYATMYTDYSSASASTVVNMNAGDTVYVGKCTGNGQIDAYKTSFSGFLVNKLE